MVTILKKIVPFLTFDNRPQPWVDLESLNLPYDITMQIISTELKLFHQSKLFELHKSEHFNIFLSGFVTFIHHIHLLFLLETYIAFQILLHNHNLCGQRKIKDISPLRHWIFVSSDMCAEKIPLVSKGGQAEGQACADPCARTPIGARGIFFLQNKFKFILELTFKHNKVYLPTLF